MYLCTANHRSTNAPFATGRHANADVAETLCRVQLWREVNREEWKPWAGTGWFLAHLDTDFDFTVRLTRPLNRECVT